MIIFLLVLLAKHFIHVFRDPRSINIIIQWDMQEEQAARERTPQAPPAGSKDLSVSVYDCSEGSTIAGCSSSDTTSKEGLSTAVIIAIAACCAAALAAVVLALVCFFTKKRANQKAGTTSMVRSPSLDTTVFPSFLWLLLQLLKCIAYHVYFPSHHNHQVTHASKTSSKNALCAGPVRHTHPSPATLHRTSSAGSRIVHAPSRATDALSISQERLRHTFRASSRAPYPIQPLSKQLVST